MSAAGSAPGSGYRCTCTESVGPPVLDQSALQSRHPAAAETGAVGPSRASNWAVARRLECVTSELNAKLRAAAPNTGQSGQAIQSLSREIPAKFKCATRPQNRSRFAENSVKRRTQTAPRSVEMIVMQHFFNVDSILQAAG